MLSNDFGRAIFANAVHLKNALSPMAVSPSLSCTLLSLSQYMNMLLPMFLMVDGKEAAINEWQLEKAASPNVSTPSGMTIA